MIDRRYRNGVFSGVAPDVHMTYSIPLEILKPIVGPP
jgi:hypothetical protein